LSGTGKVQEGDAHLTGDAALPIFFDPTARRRIWVRIAGTVLLVAFLVWSIGFGASLYMLSKLSQADGKTAFTRAYPLADMLDVPMPTPTGQDRVIRATDLAKAPTDGLPQGTVPFVTSGETTVYAYLPYWPDWNYAALTKAWPTVGVVLPEWYRLDLQAAILAPLGPEAAHQRAVASVLRFRQAGQVLPVVNVSDIRPDASAQAAGDLSQVVAQIVRTAGRNHYGGMCFNISGLSSSAFGQIGQLLLAVHEAFRALKTQTCLVAPADSAIWNDRNLTEAIDRAVVLGFRDASVMAAPNPIAPQGWFAREIPPLIDRIGTAKVVLALGAAGYDWTEDDAVPRQVDYAEAMRIAELHDSEVRFDPVSLNTTFSYFDGRHRHTVWILDAATAYNQLLAVSRVRLGGVAVWPLTGADPSVWTMLASPNRTNPPQELLHRISTADYVGYEGAGAFQRVLHAPRTGDRTIETDPASGIITGVTYSRLPQPFTILRYGAGEGRTIALTFDDGPDPLYTQEILKILKAYDVPATFFVVGSNALGAPWLLSEMTADGHEIGVHTFLHPFLERTPSWRVRFELSATERLIASITGRQTALFRAPYGRTEGPLTGDEAWPMREVEKYGYLVVGADIAPPDWTKVSAAEIAALVERSAHPAIGNVLALHDAGGDRRATVAALPGIIEALRKRGYRFVPLSSFLGKTRDDLMPLDHSPGATFDAASFEFIRIASVGLHWTFWAVLLIGMGRAVYVVTLAQLRRRHEPRQTPFTPPVTVVIPAYCEEAVIAQTITAVLASDYPDLKLLVVDDGSTDETASVARAAGGPDRRVEVVSQPNGGKFSALNRAYAMIDADIVVGIDADTVIRPDAIGLLVRHFEDPAVGAVAGNVKIRNSDSLLTRLQSLEYITAQNIDRRAAEVLNGILVVPGAIGAWRREAVEKAGLYSPQTLAEDADLTVSIVRAGYRIVYEECAFAMTEAPESVRQFLRQRLRWMLGMLQTAWKHRGAIGERRWIGLISIPELFLFGMIMAVLAPIADFMMASALLNGLVDMLVMPGQEFGDVPASVLAGYGAFMIVDILMGAIAFRFEPGEDKKLLLLLPFQRFVYRQLLYVTAMRTLYVVLTGRLMRWQKVTHAAPSQPGTAIASRSERRRFQLVRTDAVADRKEDGINRPMSGNRSRSAALR